MTQAKPIVKYTASGVASAVVVWTPGVIAFVTFLFGFPSGIVLAAINWYRMEMRSKANLHLLIGGLGLLLVLLVFLLVPNAPGYWVGWFVNILVLTYLRFRMKEDIERIKVGHPVRNANWLAGLGLGLGVLVGWAVAFMTVLFFVLLVYTLSSQ